MNRPDDTPILTIAPHEEEATIEPARKTPADLETPLTTYFRDLATLPLMTAKEETSLSLRIEAEDHLLWQRLLSHPPILDRMLDAIQTWSAGAKKDLAAVQRAAVEVRRTRSKAARVKLDRAAAKAAVKMRIVDEDRLAVAAACEVARIPGVHARWAASVREARQAGEASRHEFVRRNLRLVVTLARRFKVYGLPLSDLIQEGNLGLMKAVDRYDPRRGFRFSTYASWWIRHGITRALADKARLVRVPVHRLDSRARVRRAARVLSAKLGRFPTAKELARETGLDLLTVERASAPIPEHAMSLDQPRDGEDDRTLHDSLRDPHADEKSPIDAMSRDASLAQLERALATLKPLEREVVRKRFGLGDQDERTLQDIGDDYGLSRERIRQIEGDALRRLRKAMERAESQPRRSRTRRAG